MDVLYLVVPCYNEEAVLAETSRQLLDKLTSLIKAKKISESSRAIFVDDGSSDRTWEIISNLYKSNKLFSGIKLSRNKGHQNALLAGLMVAKDIADFVISLDADLQDDIDTIDKFVDKYHEVFDIVYGVRNKRTIDTFFKRTTAVFFYKLMKSLGVDIIENHADYRLMSKRAIEGLAQFKEVNLFLRGLVPLVGYKSTIVYYERHERFAGISKYPLKKMLSFALDGITSFSIKPIRIISSLGLSMFLISICMLTYFLIIYCMGITVQGWTTITISIWGIGGLQLLAIGIVGEYIGKIYLETKNRPKYIIEEILNKDEI